MDNDFKENCLPFWNMFCFNIYVHTLSDFMFFSWFENFYAFEHNLDFKTNPVI